MVQVLFGREREKDQVDVIEKCVFEKGTIPILAK